LESTKYLGLNYSKNAVLHQRLIENSVLL